MWDRWWAPLVGKTTCMKQSAATSREDAIRFDQALGHPKNHAGALQIRIGTTTFRISNIGHRRHRPQKCTKEADSFVVFVIVYGQENPTPQWDLSHLHPVPSR